MLALIATFCSGTFFGAAVYISLAQHPASLAAGGSVPGTFFPPMYRRAAPMQVSLAVAGTLTGLAQWYGSRDPLWLAGALLLGSVIPITLLYIKPVNDPLLAPGSDPASAETLRLLKQWGARHWLRSVVSGAAFVVCLLALI